jgi:16S rRNA (uracil1498-N3)-methyltransferase
MHIFYQPNLSTNEILLNEEESKHCVRVLRMKMGDEVQLIDGKGTSAIAKIIDDNPKKCVLNILNRKSHVLNRTYKLHIAVAPTKNFDRMEWFIEKAIEVGIDEISFIETENSERSKINLHRCEKIAISAIKQSKQFWLPKINDVIPYGKFFENSELRNSEIPQFRFIAYCETDISNTFHQHIFKSSHQHINILIGPEGDFTQPEVDTAKANGFIPVSFGENRLRTETAALYACMATHILLAK